ncbi:MAG: lipid A deacylase LpxR family protein [Flavobacteriaceae bacterium]|nr:lipid A deacylase LpxR family protein [Flavobacteriaceae bacterium]
MNWKLILYLGFVFVSFGNISAQESGEKVVLNQLEIGHDNDFFLLTDRYYSSGIFLGYSRKLRKGVFSNTSEQLTFNLGHEVFTPNNIDTELIEEMDRLYAGYLRLNSTWNTVKGNSLFKVTTQLGMVGPASGAGAFQRWYHNAIVRWPTPSWKHELDNEFHANLLLGYHKEWKLLPVPFGVHVAVSAEIAAGTKDVYAQPELALFFGRRNKMSETIAYNRIGSTQREIFFALKVGYRWVGANAFLEEAPFGENSNFSIERKNTILNLGFDFRHRYGKNDYKIGYRFLTREANTVTDHQYLTFAYGRSF